MRAAFALVILFSALASQAQDSVTLDFPRESNASALPIGLSNWPKESFDGLAAIEIPLLRLNDEGILLVTVVFQDDADRIIQVKWKTPSHETLLSSNIAEGVKGWNQRVLSVPYELLSEAGSLVFETEAETQPIKRINLAWTWPTGIYMGTAAQNVEVIQDAHRVLTKKDLADRVAGPVPDAWAKGIWKAFLQEDKESLDEALAFSFAMDSLPKAAIFRGKILGLPLNAVPDIWVNDQKVEPVAVQIPDLATDGFFRTPDGTLSYAGWRELAVSIPAKYFRTGDNTVIFGEQKGAYVKESMLELSFEAEGAPFVVPGEKGLPASASTPPAAVPSVSTTSWSYDWPQAGSSPQKSGPAVISVPVSDKASL